MNEFDTEAAVVVALRDAGYQLVQSNVPVTPESHRRTFDVVAWAPNSVGELAPTAAVEIKRSAASLADALSHLALARDLLGTTRHYAVLGNRWFAAAAGLLEATEIPGPEQAPGGQARLTDPALVTEMLSRRMLQLTDRRRDSRPAKVSLFRAADDLIEQTLTDGGLSLDGQTIAVDRDVLAKALFDGILQWLSHSEREYLTLPAVGAALGRLLAPSRSGVVIDPFCGSGSLLWHTRMAAPDVSLRYFGQDLNPDIAALAQRLSTFLSGPADIRVGDSLLGDLPPADYVISEPPAGPRRTEAGRLSNDRMTTDLHLLAIDRCVRLLRHGGRAVVHSPGGWLWRENAAHYRAWLATSVHVASLLALPPGAFAGTAIESVIVVIQNRPPAETFVAQFDGDWASQLASGGPALTAYLDHLTATS